MREAAQPTSVQKAALVGDCAFVCGLVLVVLSSLENATSSIIKIANCVKSKCRVPFISRVVWRSVSSVTVGGLTSVAVADARRVLTLCRGRNWRVGAVFFPSSVGSRAR